MCARSTSLGEASSRKKTLNNQDGGLNTNLISLWSTLLSLDIATSRPRLHRIPIQKTQFQPDIMAATPATAGSSLPPDLFDNTTLISLASTLAILAVAYATSLKALSQSTSGSYRFLFIWHLFDAGIHFFLEGSFLYHVCQPPRSLALRQLE